MKPITTYSVRIYLEYSDMWYEVQEYSFIRDAIETAKEISKTQECKVFKKVVTIDEDEITY